MSPILLFLLFLVIGFLAAFLIRCHQKHYHKGPVKPSDLPAPPHHPLPQFPHQDLESEVRFSCPTASSCPSASPQAEVVPVGHVQEKEPRVILARDPAPDPSEDQPRLAGLITDVIFHLGFVAVDADGSIFIYDRMPVRDQERKAWYPRPDDYPSDRGCFEANFLRPTVTLTWDDEPRLCYFSIFNTDNG